MMDTLTELVNRLKTWKEETRLLKNRRGEVERGTATRTHRVGAVIDPQRFLHEGPQQELPVADGAAGQVLLDADGSAFVEVPVEIIWSDVRTSCNQARHRWNDSKSLSSLFRYGKRRFLLSAVTDQRLLNHSDRLALSFGCRVRGLRGGPQRSDADRTASNLLDGKSTAKVKI